MRKNLKTVDSKSEALRMNINFLEYPMFLPIKKNNATIYKVYGVLEDEHNVCKYTLSTLHELPNSEDFKILATFLHLAQKKNTLVYKLDNVNSFLTLMKGSYSGNGNHSYYKKRILASLKKWAYVALEFENSFFESATKTKGKVKKSYGITGILDCAWINSKEFEEDNFELKDIEIEFSKFFWKANEAKFSILLNLNHILDIKSQVAQRLYQVLIKNFYGINKKGCMNISLEKLISKLGLGNVPNIGRSSVIKSKIDSAMKELNPVFLQMHHTYLSTKEVLFYFSEDE